MESGEKRVEWREWREESGEKRVEGKEWREENVKWREESGEWREESGENRHSQSERDGQRLICFPFSSQCIFFQLPGRPKKFINLLTIHCWQTCLTAPPPHPLSFSAFPTFAEREIFIYFFFFGKPKARQTERKWKRTHTTMNSWVGKRGKEREERREIEQEQGWRRVESGGSIVQFYTGRKWRVSLSQRHSGAIRRRNFSSSVFRGGWGGAKGRESSAEPQGAGG